MENVPYANIVGCLIYETGLTRPDVSHVISVVSRYMASPGREHQKTINELLGI